jgi:hypothetical protein
LNHHSWLAELWIDERRSRRFPEGLLDQPFYGWVARRNLKISPL